MADIFAKNLSAKPTQPAAVAERRFGDAEALCKTGENARANGAMYLAGLVIDILLKAQLMRQYPEVARKRPHEVTEGERRIWSLIWRSHDLAEMLEQHPSLAAAVAKLGEQAGRPYLTWLNQICGTWTIFVRYSSLTTEMEDARVMLERVRVLKEVLK